jgi:phage terminase large subunit
VLRPYQREALQALKAGKNVFSIIHRRAGKDIMAMDMLTMRGLMRVGTHVYLMPYQKQAREVIWDGMDGKGIPFLASIPPCLIAKKNDARMQIRLINGSRLVFGGSNNITSIIGSNPVTIIYSEYALHHPQVSGYLNPILTQNGGLEIKNSTPRGMNHCYEAFEAAKQNPAYFCQHLGYQQTFDNDGNRIITEEMIEAERKKGVSEELLRQEWMCDFSSGNQGAYFTREYNDMEREGRIGDIRFNTHLPLHTVWDLGAGDATVGILFQINGRYIDIIHCIHDVSKPFKWYLETANRLRQQMQLVWGSHYVPHDVHQKHQGFEQVESRMTMARAQGWILQTVPKVNIEDGIEAMRFAFPNIRINKLNCHMLIRAIREYAREYDEEKARYKDKPLHNWAADYADALRYLSVNYRRLYAVPSAPSKYSVGNA